MTQEEIVKQHLEREGTITSWEAIEKYRITRLSDRIHTLRKKGMEIETEMKKSTRDPSKQYALYKYKGEE